MQASTALDIPIEAPPSLGEAWRTVWKIGVLRRIFFALPFLAAPFRWSLVPAGYVVASAVDSQKLWIVEGAA